MMKCFRSVAPLALALVAGLAACDDGTSARMGSLTVQLTDAPGDEIVEAWVTITDIYLQGENGEADPPGGRVYLLEDGDETHELTELANAIVTLVADQEVPVGTYGQLRMVLSGGCIETDDGSVFASDGYTECGTPTGELQMPSMQQSGLKVNLNGFTVTSGQQIVLLDFVVADSYGRAAGQSNRWVMSPVIHGAEIQLSGGLDVTLSSGEVELPDGIGLGDFSATLLPENGDSTRLDFEDPGEDEVFEVGFRYVVPGQGPFEVRLNAPDGFTATVDPASPLAVTITGGAMETVDWVLQSIEAEDDS